MYNNVECLTTIIHYFNNIMYDNYFNIIKTYT